MKQYDLEPTFEVQLLDGVVAVDLSNAVTATFIMRNRKGAKVVAPMVVADQSQYPGVVSYAWRPGDTNTSGTFSAEVEILWPSGRPQTYPGKQYMRIDIQRDLNRRGADGDNDPNLPATADGYSDGYFDTYPLGVLVGADPNTVVNGYYDRYRTIY